MRKRIQYGLVLQQISLSHWLQCSHSMWVLVQVLAVSLLTYLPANAQALRSLHSKGSLDEALGSRLWPRQNLVVAATMAGEETNGKIFCLPKAAFQINTQINKHGRCAGSCEELQLSTKWQKMRNEEREYMQQPLDCCHWHGIHDSTVGSNKVSFFPPFQK